MLAVAGAAQARKGECSRVWARVQISAELVSKRTLGVCQIKVSQLGYATRSGMATRCELGQLAVRGGDGLSFARNSEGTSSLARGGTAEAGRHPGWKANR